MLDQLSNRHIELMRMHLLDSWGISDVYRALIRIERGSVQAEFLLQRAKEISQGESRLNIEGLFNFVANAASVLSFVDEGLGADGCLTHVLQVVIQVVVATREDLDRLGDAMC